MRRVAIRAAYGGMIGNITASLWLYVIFNQELALRIHLIFSVVAIILANCLFFFQVRVKIYQSIGLFSLFLFTFNIVMLVNGMIFSEYGSEDVREIVLVELLLFFMGVFVSLYINGKRRYSIAGLKRFNFLSEKNQTLKINAHLGQLLTNGRNYKNIFPLIFTFIFFVGLGISKQEATTQVVIASLAAFLISYLVGYLLVLGYAVYELASRYERETGNKLYLEGFKKNPNKVEKGPDEYTAG